jgi:DNA-3-methyladenine glycosylase
MRLGRRLPQRFFARPCLEVARDLVGCVLVHELAGAAALAGRLVEVEAYLGNGTDPSAHSHGGPTQRNRSMFGPPGRLYSYRSYGIHTCVNLVCEPAGSAAAVLLRAVEPLQGVDIMRQNRGLAADCEGCIIASGPGRLAQAFGLGLEHDGCSVVGRTLRVHAPHPSESQAPVVTGPRVGISRAADLPYRFYAKDDPWVSPWRAGKAKR